MNESSNMQRALSLAKKGNQVIARGHVTLFINPKDANSFVILKASPTGGIDALDCDAKNLAHVLDNAFSELAPYLNMKWSWRAATNDEIDFISTNTSGLDTENSLNQDESSIQQHDGTQGNYSDCGIGGWIYVLVNSSMPSVVKIGRTDRTPSERVYELSSATGVPTPFVLVWEEETGNSIEAELQIHKRLNDKRVNSNREFFEVDAKSAIQIVVQVCSLYPVGAHSVPTEQRISHDRLDDLLVRSLRIVQETGSVEPRIIRMKLGANFEESRLVFEKLQIMGAIDKGGNLLRGYWSEELSRALRDSRN